jgi:hypothetical protein
MAACAKSSKVDARTEGGFFIFFRRSLEFVSRGELQVVSPIDLDTVMAIDSKDNETMRVVSIVGYARTTGRSLSASVRTHVPTMEVDCAVAARVPIHKTARNKMPLIIMPSM